MNEEEIARLSARAFWAGDRFSAAMGFEMVDVGPGWARVRGVVGDTHLNVHDTAHGGYLFALAGSAFGLACNSRGSKVVAQQVSVIYADRAVAGEVLTAEAREVTQAGRTGIYDIAVTREDGSRVALVRGVSRVIGGSYLD